MTSKVLPIPDAMHAVSHFRREGGVIVLAHGCWDVLHVGHMQHLRAAKALGNYLVVSVTPDRFVGKGPDRPRFSEALRAEALSSLECVDLVVINDEETAEQMIRELRPHVYVKGVEYRSAEHKTDRILREEAAAAEVGCRVEFVTGDVVCSSTQLLGGKTYG